MLDNMTHEKWARMSRAERDAVRDNSKLTPQLVGFEGDRVEAVTTYGETRRFWVGKSTGWKPIHLEIKTSRSMGGDAADRAYQSVKLIRKGPR